jgi:hypothetical protein
VDPPPLPLLPVHRAQGASPSRSRRACGVPPGRPLARARTQPPRASLPSRAGLHRPPQSSPRRRTSLPSCRGYVSSSRLCSSFRSAPGHPMPSAPVGPILIPCTTPSRSLQVPIGRRARPRRAPATGPPPANSSHRQGPNCVDLILSRVPGERFQGPGCKRYF